MPYNAYQSACGQLDNIEAIDFYLAQALLAKLPEAKTLDSQDMTEVFHLFIALSAAQRDGHSCLDLTLVAGKQLFASEEDDVRAKANSAPKLGYTFAELERLKSLLSRLQLTVNDPENAVVYEQGKVYLRRYRQFEAELAQFINEKLSSSEANVSDEQTHCKAILDALFPNRDDNPDWQLMAVANALNKSFTIIAGGPGTGKTYTVTKLLAGLLMQNPDHNIAMVAPTGKAAQRLSESIEQATQAFSKQQLIADDILANIPKIASTIHRLLGVIPNSPNFRHDSRNPLSCDVLLVDEVSMVDLPMMTRLFRALPKQCKVIMLGDAEQLPSVATGSVLADLAPVKQTQYSQKNRLFLKACTGQTVPEHSLPEVKWQTDEQMSFDYLTYLTKSRRFAGDGGIGKIARQVIDGDAKSAWALLTKGDNAELSYIHNQGFEAYIKQLTKTYYQPIFSAKTVDEAFTCLNRFRILAPVRQGNNGLDAINPLIEKTLRSLKCIHTSSELYKGRPIMISQNHYGVNLFNGDIGILWPSRKDKQRLVAIFPGNGGDKRDGENSVTDKENTVAQDGYREVSISRLPAFETVYAMTIHKTQGSEFENVALVLPEQASNRLLSRELIYTGITRAKSHLQIYCQKSTWTNGVQKRVDRASGLTERLLALLTH